MTVSNQSVKTTVNGNGVQTIFNYSFPIMQAGAYSLYLTDPSNITTLLSQSLYSVSDIGEPNGGTFEYPLPGQAGPIAVGNKLTFVRQIPFTQNTNLRNQGKYLPASVEGMGDWLAYQDEQLNERLLRSFLVPVVEEGPFTYPPLATRIGKYAGYGNSGEPVVFDAGPSISGTTVIATGTTTARTLANRFAEVYNPLDWGAIPGTDSRAAFQAAIDAANAAGGGIVDPGTFQEFLIGNNGSGTGLTLKSLVILQNSNLKLANSANAHMIEIGGCNSSAIVGCWLNGNSANQVGNFHIVRGGSSAEHINFERVRALNASYYGYGLQIGSFKYIQWIGCLIENTGADGIDLKNTLSLNTGIVIDGLLVRLHGRSAVGDSAGVDIRAQGAVLNGISVIEYGGGGAGNCGIRFRHTTVPQGTGGNYCSLSGFFCDPGAQETNIGLSLDGVFTAVGDGVIKNCVNGVRIQQEGNSCDNVKCIDCLDGWNIVDGGTLGTQPDHTQLDNCSAISCDDEGFLIERQCCLNNCVSRLNTGFGVLITATSTDTSINDGEIRNNTAGQISDSGMTTHIRGVLGVVTENNALSGPFAIDAIAVVTGSISHGLAFTPNNYDCVLTLLRETSVTDFVVAFIRITTVTSTLVNFEVRITTASATGGAQARLGLMAKTKL